MTSLPWVMIAIAVLLVLFAVVAIIYKKDKPMKPDYYTFFVMGLIWVLFGIPTDNPALWMMGLVFLAVGLLNKDKWEENRKRWKDLSKQDQRLKLILVVGLTVTLVLGIGVFLLTDRVG